MEETNFLSCVMGHETVTCETIGLEMGPGKSEMFLLYPNIIKFLHISHCVLHTELLSQLSIILLHKAQRFYYHWDAIQSQIE